MIKLYRNLFGVIVLFFTTQVFAVTDPVEFTKEVTAEVLSAVKKNHQRIQNNEIELMRVVNHLILPYFDFTEMSRWVAGRNAWRRATASEKRRFVSAFKTLVVRTYAQALKDLQDDEIEFQPLRTDFAGKKRVVVSSIVRKNGKTSITVLFRLILEQSNWKVYDLVVEGVSLLKGYQAQFSSKIRQNGLGYVIEEIESHNRIS